MAAGAAHDVRKFPGYCYNCVAGPDLLEVKVVDGVATEILPNSRRRRHSSRPTAGFAFGHWA